MNGTVEKVIKQSLIYSCVVSQPFIFHVDAYPVIHNKLLIEDNEQLSYGEHGQVVRLLQHKLTNLSYYEDSVDGDFDIITEHALKKFQDDFNIDITGQADPHTVNTIIKAEKKKLLNKVEELTESIYAGMQSDEVEIVQETLQYFGYYDGEIDGIYGPLTESALKVAEDEHDISLLDQMAGPSLAELSEAEAEKEQSQQNAEAKEVDVESVENQQNEVKDKGSESKQNGENKQKNRKQKEIKTVEVNNLNNSNVIQAARSLVGTPYEWGGTSPGGFDCSGLINYVFESQGITVPRTVNEMWNFGTHVDQPSIGDLVFFETYKLGPSHMGIYVGDGQFIHAGESRGVETSELSNIYWKDKYIGAKRID